MTKIKNILGTATMVAVLSQGAWAETAPTRDSLPPLKNGIIPTNVDELWGNYDPSKEPLETQVVREWKEGDITIRHVVFTIGTFKGQKSRLAAFYAFPKSDRKLPGILQIHGGGGRAQLSAAIWAADNGYAGLSINWLGFPMDKMQEGDANTDWGAIDPTQKHNTHYDGDRSAKPDPKTLDAIESPRNNNWFLLILAARRSLTFLEQQPEVDATKLGVTGHSMGGKITVDLAGIDKRVKAAVPSCGGSGGVTGKLTGLPESVVKPRKSDMMTATILNEAYIPFVTCPILFTSASNDHAGPFDAMSENWKKITSKIVRYAIVPHFTHRSLPESEVCTTLWFDQHLKGTFAFPETPELTVNLKTADGVPQVTVKADRPDEVVKVEIYYSIDPNFVMRFWRDAEARKNGEVWVGNCPILSTAQPLIVYANVFYPLKKDVVMERRVKTPPSFMITSRQVAYHPDELVAAGVKATDTPSRLIDDFSRGWHDWYRLSWGNPHHWVASTRKIHDLKWRGPEGSALVFEVLCPNDNMLAVEARMNVWGTFPGKPSGDYLFKKALKGSPEWQTVSIKLEEMIKKDSPIPLPSWEMVTELNFSRPATCMVDGKEVEFGKGWDMPLELRNMRWEGGVERMDVVSSCATLLRKESLSRKGPTEAFLMAYFVGDSVEENRMHLCWSLDGLHWTALNNDKPVVISSLSTKAIRDPAILRKQDGTFVLMYTDAAWSVGQKPTCGFWDSPDLVNWTNQRIRTLSSNPAVPAWGPEAIYDPASGQYIVLWSTASSDSLWYNTTSDFNTFSPEARFFTPGYQVLENNIVQYGEYYYLIFKDERGGNVANTPYKALKVARSTSLTQGSFTVLTDDYISPHLSEGPVICKAINADRWYLYYDMFMEGGIFKCSTTTNLNSGTSGWTRLPDNQFSLPKRVRNGHILEIDREELKRLRDVWDNGPNFAEGCTAIASSASDGKQASKANDLNYNTFWSAAAGKGANEWLEINLGTSRTFNKTVIRQSNSDRITGYKIQYHNGTEWADAYTGGSLGTQVRIDTFPPVTSSRVRLLVTAVQPGVAAAGGETDNCPQINEFDVYLNTRKITEDGKQ